MKYESEEWKRRIEKANAVSLVAYCDHAGIAVVPFGSEYRHREYDSLKIRDNKWKRWSEKTELLGRFTQGYPIQFVMEYEGVNFETAIEKLLAFCDPDELPLPSAGSPKKKKKYDYSFEKRVIGMTAKQKMSKKQGEGEKPFVKPNKYSNNEKVYTYLTKTRCIDPELVKEQLKLGLLYESTPYHNCVFVGMDGNGNPAYAFQRGTVDGGKKFAGEVTGSNKEWVWNYAPDKDSTKLFVFEAVIDALSFMTLHMGKGEGWKHAHYLPLDCLADRALVAYLQRNPHIESITFCLDNDEPGKKATEKYMKLYADLYYCGSMPPPEGYKDWNEYLVAVKTPKES